MKKTTASLCLIISIASAPALAERNPADPYEGYNRTVSKFNDKADKYVLSPVARGYRKVTPKPVRTGVSNFFNNLRDVVSFGSHRQIQLHTRPLHESPHPTNRRHAPSKRRRQHRHR